MTLRLIPLRDRVIIEPKDAATMTQGGILIPDTYQERPKEGHVRAVGPGRYENGVLIPMTLKVGDVVIFSKYAGTEIKHDGIEYVMIPEDNCNCIVLPLPEIEKGHETWSYQCDCGEYKTVPDFIEENVCHCGKAKKNPKSLTGETSDPYGYRGFTADPVRIDLPGVGVSDDPIDPFEE